MSEVNAKCSCVDARTRGGLCKHAAAVALVFLQHSQDLPQMPGYAKQGFSCVCVRVWDMSEVQRSGPSIHFVLDVRQLYCPSFESMFFHNYCN